MCIVLSWFLICKTRVMIANVLEGKDVHRKEQEFKLSYKSILDLNVNYRAEEMIRG